jgi:hypothetical protein
MSAILWRSRYGQPHLKRLLLPFSFASPKREVRHASDQAPFDQVSDRCRDCCQRRVGACRSHSQSSTSRGGGVLLVRRLSRPLRSKGGRRAQASSGGARCGPSSRRWQLKWRRQSRWGAAVKACFAGHACEPGPIQRPRLVQSFNNNACESRLGGRDDESGCSKRESEIEMR